MGTQPSLEDEVIRLRGQILHVRDLIQSWRDTGHIVAQAFADEVEKALADPTPRLTKFELDITFTTARPLSQNCGMEMWGIGRFRTWGERTYRLKSLVEANTLTLAEQCIVKSIQDLVKDDLPAWPDVQVIGISSREVKHRNYREL